MGPDLAQAGKPDAVYFTNRFGCLGRTSWFHCDSFIAMARLQWLDCNGSTAMA